MEILNVLLDEERKNKNSRFSTVCKDVIGLIDERVGFIPGSVENISGDSILMLEMPIGGLPVGTIAFSIDGNLLVCDGWAQKLHIFDRKGLVIKILTHETFKHPGSVVVDYSSGNIAVLDFRSNQVVVFDRAYNFLLVLGSGVLDNPQSIAVAENGDIIICQRARLGASTILLAFSKDGTFLKKCVKDVTLATQTSSPYISIAYHRNNIFAEKGGVMQIFSYPEMEFVSESATKTSREVGDVVCDRDGNVVVTEPYGATISVYSSTGKYLKSFPTPNNKPNGVAIDQDGSIVYVDVSSNMRPAATNRLIKIT